jgi:hypothetical protein
MTDEQRHILRSNIGLGVKAAQDQFKHLTPEEVIPEIIAALLSFAAYTALHNANMRRIDFRMAYEAAITEVWGSE